MSATSLVDMESVCYQRANATVMKVGLDLTVWKVRPCNILLCLQHWLSSLDVNECETDNGGCEQQCINTPGDFICRCDQGMTLESDERTCSNLLTTSEPPTTIPETTSAPHTTIPEMTTAPPTTIPETSAPPSTIPEMTSAPPITIPETTSSHPTTLPTTQTTHTTAALATLPPTDMTTSHRATSDLSTTGQERPDTEDGLKVHITAQLLYVCVRCSFCVCHDLSH